MDSSDPARDAIHEVIQKHAAMSTQDGAVLTGWVLVAEWMTPDGDRWLSKAHAAGTTAWAARGMMHDAIHGRGWEES